MDLTHTITPSIPVWAGFGPSEFSPTIDPKTGKAYEFGKDGFEATRYVLEHARDVAHTHASAALADWRQLFSDADAQFDAEHRFDARDVERADVPERRAYESKR